MLSGALLRCASELPTLGPPGVSGPTVARATHPSPAASFRRAVGVARSLSLAREWLPRSPLVVPDARQSARRSLVAESLQRASNDRRCESRMHVPPSALSAWGRTPTGRAHRQSATRHPNLRPTARDLRAAPRWRSLRVACVESANVRRFARSSGTDLRGNSQCGGYRRSPRLNREDFDAGGEVVDVVLAQQLCEPVVETRRGLREDR
jgi:hypothetical protein